MKTFYFNTGVKRTHQTNYLCKGQIWQGDVKVIPFDCDKVPENARFLYACDNPNLESSKHIIVREMFNTVLLSKYAYFQIL